MCLPSNGPTQRDGIKMEDQAIGQLSREGEEVSRFELWVDATTDLYKPRMWTVMPCLLQDHQCEVVASEVADVGNIVKEVDPECTIPATSLTPKP